MWMLNHPNDLTVRLLTQGYTPDNLPDGVKWGSGEAEYTRETIRARVYETPCGLLVQGGELSNGWMSYGGVDWRHENDNPVICCPYVPTRKHCELQDKRLPPPSSLPCRCALHLTDRTYSEAESAHSVHEAQEQADNQREKAALAVLAREVAQRGVGYCSEHARWKRETQEALYLYDYDPNVCPSCCDRPRCLRCGVDDGMKRGNVLADVHIWRRRVDGTLLDGEVTETIIRGIKLFEKSRRLAVCQMTVDSARSWVERALEGRSELREDLYFERCHWKDGRFRAEVENIRVVQSGQKDKQTLLDDLRAASNGATIIHAADAEKAAQAAKKERRETAKRKRLEKLIGKIADGKAENIDLMRYERECRKDQDIALRLQEVRDKLERKCLSEENAPRQESMFELISNRGLERE